MKTRHLISINLLLLWQVKFIITLAPLRTLSILLLELVNYLMSCHALSMWIPQLVGIELFFLC